MNDNISKAIMKILSHHQPHGVMFNDLLLAVHDELNLGQNFAVTQDQIANELQFLIKQKTVKGSMNFGDMITL